jgi:hypothetical protein
MLGNLRLGQDWPSCTGYPLQTPFNESVLGELAANGETLSALQAINRLAPKLLPWLENPRLADIDSLKRLSDGPARFGLQLHLCLQADDCQASSQQLENLLSFIEQWPQQHISLSLMLRDAPSASPTQLQLCIALAKQFACNRITLCDEHGRLTPLGVRDRLSHVSQYLPPSSDNPLSLAFMAGNQQGLAIANSVSAIANGSHYIHIGILAAGALQHGLTLSQLLHHYRSPDQQALYHYAERIAELTGLAQPPEPLLGQPPSQRPTPNIEAPGQDQLRFIFRVSSYDWHVQLQIEHRAELLDLGERVHHYVLLLLAREFCQQQQLNGNADCDPMSLGWIERERLHKMIGDSDTHLNNLLPCITVPAISEV